MAFWQGATLGSSPCVDLALLAPVLAPPQVRRASRPAQLGGAGLRRVDRSRPGPHGLALPDRLANP
eukprot:scaffold2714_cov413-Prasinococcus_capsulatus_cf.AAC.1